MEKLVIIRYSEIHLKGRNRSFFENLLLDNIKTALAGFNCQVIKYQSRYVVCGFDNSNTNSIVEKLKKVFGIHSISIAIKTQNDLEQICLAAQTLCATSGTFRITANRADKTFYLNSQQLSREVGGYLLSKNSELKVDLHNPACEIFVDMRENNQTFIFDKILAAADGMPVGASGNGLVLLSGGIDSPVAAYYMAKRGMTLNAIHFHSFPYTSDRAKQKVIDLCYKIRDYLGNFSLYTISATAIQEAIHKHCPENLAVILLRRFMMAIAEKVADKTGAHALITGEALAQVASQTMESIVVTNNGVSRPILRPLIGFDKEEIVAVAKKIDTYSLSVLPYEDCCTAFLPKSPITKPKLEHILSAQAKLDTENLIKEALETTEIINIKG